MNNLYSKYEKDLGPKLAVIEELRSQLGKEGIQCPGVLVIGAQSAGKSSVLERLTGISFPRGENLCTRFPTIVQCQVDNKLKSPVGYVSTDPEFINSKALTSMDNIKQEISKCSDEHCASGVRIGNRPIHIRYVRTSGPVMTLIDLPGITHVDAEDKDFDIHSVTAGMVDSYVQNENMAVLVVIPAVDDFGNSEALRIAQKFDAEGKRTIGVISKSDMIGPSSDIVEKIKMIRDSDVKLNLGFIAVRNQGPNEEISDISKAENKLFTTHPLLRKLSADEWGYDTLSHKIVQLQSARVHEFIPEVRQLINEKMKEARNNLCKLGECPQTNFECQVLLTSMLVEINQYLSSQIRAQCEDPETNIAARTYQFAQEFSEAVRQDVPNLLGDDFRDGVLELIKEASGYTLPNFIGHEIFSKKISDIFFRENIPGKMEVFIGDTADLMQKVFEKAIESTKMLQTFPALSDHLVDVCNGIVEATRTAVSSVLNPILESERHQMFTLSDNYLAKINGFRMAIREKLDNNAAKKKLDDLERKGWLTNNAINQLNHSRTATPDDGEVMIDKFADKAITLGHEGGKSAAQVAFHIQISLHVYSEVLMTRLFDVISMVIRQVMVYDLQASFVVKIQGTIDEDKLLGWFSEDHKVRIQRKKYIATLKSMKKALKKIKTIMSHELNLRIQSYILGFSKLFNAQCT